jgi:hypothetical protein
MTAPNKNDPHNLGGANITELAKVSTRAFGVTPTDDLSPFDIDWHDVFHRWAGGDQPINGALTLLFSDTAQVLGKSLNCSTVYQFGSFDMAQPGVYLVSRTSTGNAWKIPDTGPDHQLNCEKIEACGLQNMVAVVMGVRSGHFLLLPSGIEGDSWSVSLKKNVLSLDDVQITSHLNAFATESLNSSETRSDIWVDASKWIPHEQAERLIQKLLMVGLRTTFINHSVISEPTTTVGRLDLLILSKDSSNSDKYVLELKAVRSHTSTGSAVQASAMVKHLEDGILQADEYRNNVGGTAAYLCVYDLRKTKGGPVIDGTVPKCQAANVELRVFDIVNSSKGARSAAAKSRSATAVK